MTTLKFADSHNMVAFLSKPAESEGFEQIVDFLNAHPIRYALTVNPTIYVSCIKQFWSSAVAKTINGEVQLHALVDGKRIVITETSVRRTLRLADVKGSAMPTDPQHTPTFIQPSPPPQKTQKPRKPKRKDTQVPQPSGPTNIVADEAVHKELGDSLVRAATTASSLEACSGGPRRQETVGDTIAQTRFENVSTQSYDPLLAREQTKTTQQNKITSLKRRVKKLDQKKRSRTHGLKRLYKVGLTTRVESSSDEESLGKDASKQGRRINDIDEDEDITLVSVQDDADAEMFDVGTLTGDEVFAEQEVAAKDVNLTVDKVTLAQALAALKSTKPKAKRIAFRELVESTTTTTPIPSKFQDKGKGKMIEPEPVKKLSKKDQLKLDEEIALKLQAEIDEEERFARAKEEKIDEANIAWDDIQAKVDVDY
ncbi:hypothetical protein Tco_1134822 [Tanacetum coccineum]